MSLDVYGALASRVPVKPQLPQPSGASVTAFMIVGAGVEYDLRRKKTFAPASGASVPAFMIVGAGVEQDLRRTETDDNNNYNGNQLQ